MAWYAEGYYGFTLGDLLVLFSAILWAILVIFIDKQANSIDSITFTAILNLIVGGLNGFTSLIFENWFNFIIPNYNNLFTPNIWIIILYISMIATSGSTVFQIEGQKQVTATRSAIIFSLEPVFATFFAVWLGDEAINILILVGSALILMSMFISIEKTTEKMQ